MPRAEYPVLLRQNRIRRRSPLLQFYTRLPVALTKTIDVLLKDVIGDSPLTAGMLGLEDSLQEQAQKEKNRHGGRSKFPGCTFTANEAV